MKYTENLSTRISPEMREFLKDEARRRVTTVGCLLRYYIKCAMIDRQAELEWTKRHEAEASGIHEV